MKKYELLVDIPGCKAGTHFTLVPANNCVSGIQEDQYSPMDSTLPIMPQSAINDRRFFKLIEEWPKTRKEVIYPGGYCFTTSYPYVIFERADSIDHYATEAQAKAALAFAKLSIIVDKMNNGWQPDWNKSTESKYTVGMTTMRGLVIYTHYGIPQQIVFKSAEAAQFSRTHHRELWEDYLMLSTVKK